MKLFTTHFGAGHFVAGHVGAGPPPVLVREGFSGAAFWFGAIWLAAHRAWIAAALTMAAFLVTLALVRLTGTGAPLIGLAVLQGLICPDLLRWSLDQRGFSRGPVVSGPDSDQALARLLDARPDLLPAAAAA